MQPQLLAAAAAVKVYVVFHHSVCLRTTQLKPQINHYIVISYATFLGKEKITLDSSMRRR
jgi:hypothetical protein